MRITISFNLTDYKPIGAFTGMESAHVCVHYMCNMSHTGGVFLEIDQHNQLSGEDILRYSCLYDPDVSRRRFLVREVRHASYWQEGR